MPKNDDLDILWMDDEEEKPSKKSKNNNDIKIVEPEDVKKELDKVNKPYIIANKKFIKAYFNLDLKDGDCATYKEMYNLMVVCNNQLVDGKILSNVFDEEDGPEFVPELKKEAKQKC